MTEPALIYVDANPFIYAIEGEAALSEAMMHLFSLFRQKKSRGITSELTLAEVLAKASPPAHYRAYLNLILGSGIVQLIAVTREILIDTAKYRQEAAAPNARSPRLPRLPDAIHVVTATRARCAIFLSADKRLKLPRGMSLAEASPTGIARLLKELS